MKKKKGIIIHRGAFSAQPCNETFFDTKGWLPPLPILADKPKFLLLLLPAALPTPSPSPFSRQAVCHFYQFLQIPHSNKTLGLCCIESLCDKAELTSLLIVKVTLKKKNLYNSYLFCSCVFGCSLSPPALVWGLFSWLNFSVAQGRVNFWECSPNGLNVKDCVKMQEWTKKWFSFWSLLMKVCVL